MLDAMSKMWPIQREPVPRLARLPPCAQGGNTRLSEVAVIAGGDRPVPPCGGCRQKLAEFAKGPVTVTLLATSGAQERTQVADLLPGAFDLDHLTAGAEDPKA